MSLENYLTEHHTPGFAYAVVDQSSNELIKAFQTDIVARAFSSSIPNSKVIWLSRRNIDSILRA